MSLLVKDFIGKRGKKGNIGIEIECEADNPLPALKDTIWISKPEGSLRKNGMEYITHGPLGISEIPGAITSLTKSLKGYLIDHKSTRTSVHMHANVMYHTPVQYWNMAVVYWLIEPLLYDFCGSHRKGNCFCLRLQDAEGVLQHSLNSLKHPNPFTGLRGDRIRYSGQNLEATVKFGSIEYRGLGFTLEPYKLNTWANALYDLSLNSKDIESPDKVMDMYFGDEPEKFLRRFLSREFIETLKTKGWEDKLDTNAGILCELAYAHDWLRWQDKINKAHAKAPVYEDIEAIFDEVPAPMAAAEQVRQIRNAWDLLGARDR